MTIKNVLVECDICKKVVEMGQQPFRSDKLPTHWWQMQSRLIGIGIGTSVKTYSLCSEVCVAKAWRLVIGEVTSGISGPQIEINLSRAGYNNEDDPSRTRAYIKEEDVNVSGT